MEELKIILNNEAVKIRIIYKNNKNIYFRFNDQNELVVTVHPRISTKKILKEEINKVLKIMPNIPEFTLKIRKMKTRWGVCNYVKKIVTLNSELIKYERNIIDYVIIHEFCHFTYHDHSTSFWRLVSMYYPEYKKARKELREQ